MVRCFFLLAGSIVFGHNKKWLDVLWKKKTLNTVKKKIGL